MDQGDRTTILAPLIGTVVWVAPVGSHLEAGSALALIESMKMEHVVEASEACVVIEQLVSLGEATKVGGELCVIGPPSPRGEEPVIDNVDDVAEGADEFAARLTLLSDEARPTAVQRRRQHLLRTARENLADLCDLGTFVEYGRFAYAAQTQRRSVDELIATTQADGLVGGIAQVNGALFGPERASAVVLSYDYMVLAGTQGQRNHKKKDRLFELAHKLALPVVFFTEGGGGRPGDTDTATVTGLDTVAFARFAALTEVAPTIGIAAGRCFAGNAALFGICDIKIACASATIGMGGPAMIEGGGLGIVAPDDVGPAPTLARAGVIDLLVEDEAEAVRAAKDIVGLWQGNVTTWIEPEVAPLAAALPKDRRRVYDPRAVLRHLVDQETLIEIGGQYALGMVTAFARLEGRPIGLIANDPRHLSGAIDTDGANKMASFLRLCSAWALPVVTICDTPGFMVGPAAEATGLVRAAGELFRAGAALKVPLCCVITRRGYGLGAQAMAGGSFVEPLSTVAWPTAELGGMGLEGAVRLGFKRELEAIEDPQARTAAFDHLVARAYEHGRALNVAAHLEIDDVIDPVTTRSHLIAVFTTARGGANENRF